MKIPPALKHQIIALGVEIVMGQLSESEAIAESLEAIAAALRTQANDTHP